MKSYLHLILSLSILICFDGKSQATENYFGQKPPGRKPELFAPGIVSTKLGEHSAPAFSPDGKIAVWTILAPRGPAYLLETRYENGKWSTPAFPSFEDSLADDFYPSFSADGRFLYFSSRRPHPLSATTSRDMSLWKVARTANGWGTPEPFDTTASTGSEMAASYTANGDVYFSSRRKQGRIFDIYHSENVNGKYTIPEPLPFSINTSFYDDGPFIATDGSYLIFESGRPGGMAGSMDLYICFRKGKHSWSEPMNMGPEINSIHGERFARVSPDGKYLFFGSTRNETDSVKGMDIFWMDASIIEELRQQAQKKTVPIDNTKGTNLLTALYEDNLPKNKELLHAMYKSNTSDMLVAMEYARALRAGADYAGAEQVLESIHNGADDPVVLTECALVAYSLDKHKEGNEFVSAMVSKGAPKWPTCITLANTLIGVGKYNSAAILYEQAIAIQPRAIDYYNLACCYSRTSNAGKAFDNLYKAAALGYKKKTDYESDTDLTSLKNDSRWAELLKKLD